MTQPDQSAQSSDGKGEVRAATRENRKLEDRIADEKDAELNSDGPAEKRERISGR